MTSLPTARRASRAPALASVLLVLLGLCLVATPARAQQNPVPPNEEANLIFEQGMEAFEEENYGMAYRRFRLVYRDYPLNPKTTAALLMAGKARYRDGAYQDAVDLLQQLVGGYGTSRYVPEAERVLGFASQQLERAGTEQRMLRLGIALPLGGDNAYLTQAMFNGIRVAVQEHNASAGRSVRMVFRDTRNDPERARQVVSELAREGMDVIVGPLFSAEAEAAGAAAEAAQVVLIAPVATDASVANGRQYVFQANPTFRLRGRIMARYAIDELNLRDFGVVGQYGNVISERMAEGFQQEVDTEGGRVRFFEMLEGPAAWGELAEQVGAEALERIDGLYAPASGRGAPQAMRALLEGLGEASTGAQLLGNSEWHDRPFEGQASTYVATYTNDFYVDPARPAVQDFVAAYRSLTDESPGALTVNAERLVYTGYDIAAYLTRVLGDAEVPVREALRTAELYEGLGVRLDFSEGNVNRAMFFFRYYDDRVERVR